MPPDPTDVRKVAPKESITPPTVTVSPVATAPEASVSVCAAPPEPMVVKDTLPCAATARVSAVAVVGVALSTLSGLTMVNDPLDNVEDTTAPPDSTASNAPLETTSPETVAPFNTTRDWPDCRL